VREVPTGPIERELDPAGERDLISSGWWRQV
jgi:hypothetical protein